MDSTGTEVEDLKKEGNEFFKKKNWKEAIERYTQAIQKISSSSSSLLNNKKKQTVNNTNPSSSSSDYDFVKATLLSNRSLCYLQQFEKANEEQKHNVDILLESVICDTTSSLEILQALKSIVNKNDDTNDVRSLRAKILYRRAKANYAMSQTYMIKAQLLSSATSSTSTSSSSSNLQQLLEQCQQCKIKAVQDLHDLLSFDSKNKLAQSLYLTIQQQQQQQQQHQQQQQQNEQGSNVNHLNHLMASSSMSLSSSNTTPIKRALSIICQYYFDSSMRCSSSEDSKEEDNNDKTDNNDNDSKHQQDMMMKVIQSLQFLYSSFVDDLAATSHEVLSYQTTKPNDNTTIQGVQVLYNLAFYHNCHYHQQTERNHHLECQSLSMHILNEASMYLKIMHLLDEYYSQQQHQQQQQDPQYAYAMNVYIHHLLHNQQTSSKSGQQKNIEKYIQLSISFYIRYMLYIHIKEDNFTYESITSCDQKDASSQITPSLSSSSSSSLSLAKQILIPSVIQMYTLLLKVPSCSDSFFSSVQSLLHAVFTIDPQSVLDQIRNSTTSNNNDDDNRKKQKQPRVLYHYPIKPLSTQDEHSLKPRELALYRKKQYMMKQNQKQRCRKLAILFCKANGLHVLLHHGIFSKPSSNNSSTTKNDKGIENTTCTTTMYNNSYWRREIMISISKVIHCFSQSNDNLLQNGNKKGSGQEDDNAKGDEEYTLNDDDLKKFIVDEFFRISEVSTTLHTSPLTIEEIDDDDYVDDKVHFHFDCKYFSKSNGNLSQELKGTLEKCVLSTSILLANGNLGTWILRKAWPSSQNEWKNLIINPLDNDEVVNYICMAIASELASAAASIESARVWITSFAGNTDDNIYWKKLLSSENQDVRSGAASAMAKLGLSDKTISSDEGELFSLLEVAGGLIIGERDETTTSNPLNSNSITQVERGIELLSYLSSKTIIKDEIAHGFTIAHSFKQADSYQAEKSLLEHLVDMGSMENFSSDKNKMTPSVAYALSNIFSSLAVSIETLRKEAFADKELTVEQYDQLQAMGKTNEEKELEESKVDQDSPEAVKARIQNMTNKGVCTAIVNLMKKGVSDSTKEHLVVCMMRMANEPSIRGKMIQHGCLSECQKVSKTKKSNNVMSQNEKKIIQSAQHTIGKLLVTTNPALLSTSQRMGSVQPLIQLIKDNDSSDLQRFEALLSVTNLAGFDDETKNRIVAEQGLSVLSYTMFSDHEMVRRAATEAMSNLVPHTDVMRYLRQPDKLKVFVAFASDFDLNYECARAASGCLAMITGDEEIARQFCKMSNSRSMVEAVLSSGKLELMHRIFVILLNLAEYDTQWLVSSGSYTFCEVYIQNYQNQKLESLDFSSKDLELMKTTICIAKEIVQGRR